MYSAIHESSGCQPAPGCKPAPGCQPAPWNIPWWHGIPWFLWCLTSRPYNPPTNYRVESVRCGLSNPTGQIYIIPLWPCMFNPPLQVNGLLTHHSQLQNTTTEVWCIHPASNLALSNSCCPHTHTHTHTHTHETCMSVGAYMVYMASYESENMIHRYYTNAIEHPEFPPYVSVNHPSM